MFFLHSQHYKLLKRVVIAFFAINYGFFFFFLPVGMSAQPLSAGINLPPPGTFVQSSQPFRPLMIKGVTLYPDNPLKMDFLVDQGDEKLSESEFDEQSQKVIRYFLASLTIPKKDLWVNLTPHEKDKIIPPSFEKTEMGRDMLMQDYMLKQLSASLLYPENEVGKRFWERIYAAAKDKYDITEIPLDLFNRVWIVPEKATLYEHETGVFVIKQHLKVMLEDDYFALSGTRESRKQDPGSDPLGKISAEVVRTIIVPELEKEVNEGKTFANLRQIFNSLILAAWYKQELKDSLLSVQYGDKNKIQGIDLQQNNIGQIIYDQYLDSIKKGVYEYVRDEYDPMAKEIIHKKYFSGGILGNEVDFEVQTSAEDIAMAVKEAETGKGIKKVTVDFQQLAANRKMDIDEWKAKSDAARALREQSLKDIRELYGDAFPYPDFRFAGMYQQYLETFFIPWSEGREDINRYYRDNVFLPYWTFLRSFLEVYGEGYRDWEKFVFSFFEAVPGFVNHSEISDAFWDQWVDFNKKNNPYWDYLAPSVTELEILRDYFRKNYATMFDSSGQYAGKVQKTLTYLQSIDGKIPQFYSKHNTVVSVPGLFKLVRVASKEGQQINPALPPALIIGPHSGHDAESLADYTNKDKTDANSLAQTFKKQGYDTYILVWESSAGLQDIGDLQEAVHLSVRSIGKKVVVAGLCHGGAVGSQYAAVRPENVVGLIVAGSPEDTEIGANDVTDFAGKGMEMPSWLQFGQGQEDVYPGAAQKFAFKYLGFQRGVHKRITKILELIENIEDIDYVERARVFDEWFEYTKNIGYLTTWVNDIFIENKFMKGTLTFRLGNEKVVADPRNYDPDMPIASIGGEKDDITPPPTITFKMISELTDNPEGLWDFLTKAIVSRSELGNQTIQGQDAFEFLSEQGYIDTTKIQDPNYAYINEPKILSVMKQLAKKNGAYKYGVADFQDNNDTAETVLPKIQALIDAIIQRTGEEPFYAQHYSEAIKWLNANKSIYQILRREELLNIDLDLVQAVESRFGASINELDQKQLISLTKLFEGTKLKRRIAEFIAPEIPVSSEREEDAQYNAEINKDILGLLAAKISQKFFSDSDVGSVNSVSGEKAVMRMPFAQISFPKKDLKAFLSVDAPFIHNTDPKELVRIFDYLSSIRGQCSGLFNYVPTKLENLMFVLIEGGHIGIYNGSKSQAKWVKIMKRFEEIWDAQGLSNSDWSLSEDTIVLAIESEAIFPQPFQDVAMPVNDKKQASVVKDELGGIDFNPDNLTINIQQTKNGIIVPHFVDSSNDIRINSLRPIIIHVSPVTNLPSLLGIK